MRALVLLLSLPLAACLISEQQGEMPQDVAFHFSSDYNKAFVAGRTLALLLVAFWAWNTERGSNSKMLTLLLGLPALTAAVWLGVRDWRVLSSYRIEVRPATLYLRIPPEPEKEVAWEAIETLGIKGFEWQRGQKLPFGGRADFWTQLPDWETMEIRAGGGQQYVVDLARLSIEQRQNLWRAIVQRARLIELK